jgi:pyrimidine operon attenuation protein/uracil phosphoribosyltransferase
MPAQLSMDAEDMARAIARLAVEIVDRRDRVGGLAFVGIQRRGAVIASRLAAAVSDTAGRRVPLGSLDISLYRDDHSELGQYPIVRTTELPFDITDRTVVLVDDVLFTGRTVRAAMAALLDYGRPRAIRLAVLIDRGHRELPIRADHVGRNVPTARDERVDVHVIEIDGWDGVEIARVLRPAAAVEAAVPATD